MIFPEDEVNTIYSTDLPIYRDWAIDLITGELKTRGGKNYLAEGKEALKIWIWHALKVARGRFLAFSDDYGCDAKDIIISADYDALEELLEEEITNALVVSEYINSVADFEFNYQNALISICCTVSTVYGEIDASWEVEV